MLRRTTATLTPLITLLPVLALFPALTLASPAAAAPVGACTVTQHGPTSYAAAREVTLERTAHTRKRQSVRRVKPGGAWRATTTVATAWNVSARVSATSTYASQECGVVATPTTAETTAPLRTRTTVTRTATAPTRAAAVRQARAKATKSARRDARRVAVGRAQEAALLAARLAFLDRLPETDRVAAPAPGSRIGARLTGAQVCPAALPWRAHRAAQQHGTVVPRFADPVAVWLCRYPVADQQGRSRMKATKVPAAKLEAVTAGLRSLEVTTGVAPCPSSHGDTVLVAHVAADGTVTGTTVERFGCRYARLTPQPHTVPAGTTATRGVPSGTYATSARLRALVDGLVGR